MTNNSTDRKSLALDRAAHRWLTDAAEETGLSVKDALEDAVRYWAHITRETELEAANLIKSATALREARRQWDEISVAAPKSEALGEMGMLKEAVGETEKMDETTMIYTAEGDLKHPDEVEPWETHGLYSANWERSKHTAAKVGPEAFCTVKEIADETDRSAKRCVEEAVQLWCILQNEHRGERATRKARQAREILEEI